MSFKILFNFILILIPFFLFLSCSAKTPKRETQVIKEKVKTPDYKLQNIKEHILKKIHAKPFKDNANSIFIQSKDDYLKIDLNDLYDFKKGSYLLTKGAKDKLSLLANALKDEEELYLVITGHANDNKNSQENQHLSDNRAISVAEFLFNAGVRDEIFAKGCSNKSIDNNYQSINRKIYIYIHKDKSNIQNHCK